MAGFDSRLGPGTLKLGTLTGAGCQMANVKLTPNHEDEDGTPTLCDPEPAPDLKTSWVLAGTAIQDFEEPSTAGFVEYARVNNGLEVAFEWVPNTSYGAVTPLMYKGTCQVRAVEIGGDVAVQVTTDWEFPVVGAISRTEPADAFGAVEIVNA